MAQWQDIVADYSSAEKKPTQVFARTLEIIILINYPSKVMWRPILSRQVKVSQAEQILKEEQAGFRSQRSTTEQIFDLRMLVE